MIVLRCTKALPFGEGASARRRERCGTIAPILRSLRKFILPSSVTAYAVPPSPKGKAFLR